MRCIVLANDINLGIVVSEFNYDVTYLMLQRALNHTTFLGAKVRYIVKVPGAFEIPIAVKKLLEKKDIDAVVALGAVIQGETRHDELVASQAGRKIMDLMIEYGKPVALGIIGPGASRMQALERVDDYARRAVEAAVKMARRLKKLESIESAKELITIE